MRAISRMGAARRILLLAVLILIAVFQLAPILAAVSNSFRTEQAIQNMPLKFPESLYLDNYPTTWVRGAFSSAYRNNLVLGAGSVCVVCAITALAGYAMVHLPVLGVRFFTVYFMVAMSIPALGYIVSLYFIFARLGLVNNLGGLIILYSAVEIPFQLLLTRAYFLGIPGELIESARIDGATEVQTVLHIMVPLDRPIVTTVALLVFIRTWNDFFFANTFLNSQDLRTVALRFYRFVSEYGSDLSKTYTSAVFAMVPIIVLFLILQRSFIEGITQGGVKG